MSRRVRSSNSGQIAPNFAVSSARLFTLQHSTDALLDATFIYLRYLTFTITRQTPLTRSAWRSACTPSPTMCWCADQITLVDCPQLSGNTGQRMCVWVQATFSRDLIKGTFIVR